MTAPVSPEASSLFTPWRDPVSGVESLLLSRRVAPVQSGFYFVNPSFTADGRFMWLYVFFPPGGQGGPSGGQLAVVDFAAGEVRHYPETLFMDASPFVDTATGEAYWTTGLEIWKRGPLAGDQATLVGAFPAELANQRRPRRIATHLTRSCDGKSFAIDAEFSPDWYIGDIPVDGSGPARIWQTFDRCYNHTQFSPTDPDLLLTAQDGWRNAATGNYGGSEDRLWLIRRGEKARPLLPDFPLSSDHRGHEWWDADGEHVWYIDYRRGTEKVNIHTGKRANAWPGGHTHSHCDRKGRLLVGDICPARDEWRVAFFNINTGREVDIVTRFPVHPAAGAGSSLSARIPGYDRAQYHIHPHPQFCCRDRYICYTTNVRGTIDLALVSVEQLLART